MLKRDPYWWVAAPLAQTVPQPVDKTCDIVIMGAGYTGLSAAITLARAGRSVQVFDRQKPGEGASSRNGGITSGNLRPSFAEMTKRFGEARASAILAEAKLAREDLYRFIAEEKLDCDFKLVGRFAGAAAPGDYEALAREAEMCYATLALVTDYDCWHPEHDSVTVELVIANLMQNADTARRAIAEAVSRIDGPPSLLRRREKVGAAAPFLAQH